VVEVLDTVKVDAILATDPTDRVETDKEAARKKSASVRQATITNKLEAQLILPFALLVRTTLMPLLPNVCSTSSTGDFRRLTNSRDSYTR
jgi:hypothetical protein